MVQLTLGCNPALVWWLNGSMIVLLSNELSWKLTCVWSLVWGLFCCCEVVLKEEWSFVWDWFFFGFFIKTTAPESGLKRRVVFGGEFNFFFMKTTVPKSGLERWVVFGVRFIFVWRLQFLKVVLIGEWWGLFLFMKTEESVRFIFYEDYSSWKWSWKRSGLWFEVYFLYEDYNS